MNNDTRPRRKKSPWTVVIVLLAVLAVVALGLWLLPSGYSTDFSKIGQGKNVVVQVHDHGLIQSVRLMDNLSKVRREYAGSVEFVVADLNLPEGRAFANANGLQPVTLVFFGPDGRPLGMVQGALDVETLRATLDRTFKIR